MEESKYTPTKTTTGFFVYLPKTGALIESVIKGNFKSLLDMENFRNILPEIQSQFSAIFKLLKRLDFQRFTHLTGLTTLFSGSTVANILNIASIGLLNLIQAFTSFFDIAFSILIFFITLHTLLALEKSPISLLSTALSLADPQQRVTQVFEKAIKSAVITNLKVLCLYLMNFFMPFFFFVFFFFFTLSSFSIKFFFFFPPSFLLMLFFFSRIRF